MIETDRGRNGRPGGGSSQYRFSPTAWVTDFTLQRSLDRTYRFSPHVRSASYHCRRGHRFSAAAGVAASGDVAVANGLGPPVSGKTFLSVATVATFSRGQKSGASSSIKKPLAVRTTTAPLPPIPRSPCIRISSSRVSLQNPRHLGFPIATWPDFSGAHGSVLHGACSVNTLTLFPVLSI